MGKRKAGDKSALSDRMRNLANLRHASNVTTTDAFSANNRDDTVVIDASTVAEITSPESRPESSVEIASCVCSSVKMNEDLVHASYERSAQRHCDRQLAQMEAYYESQLDKLRSSISSALAEKEKTIDALSSRIQRLLRKPIKIQSIRTTRRCPCTSVRGHVPFSKLSKTGKRSRLKIALASLSLIARSSSASETLELVKAIRVGLDVYSEKCTLSSRVDYITCRSLGISNRQRQKLKSTLRSNNLDVLSSSYANEKFRKEMMSEVDGFVTRAWFKSDGKVDESGRVMNEQGESPVSYVSDVCGLLQKRVRTLSSLKKLTNLDHCNGKLRIGLVSDKGATTTKLIGVIGNCSDPNSVYLTVLLLVYHGDESYANMAATFPLIYKQVAKIDCLDIGEGRTLFIEWRMTGDMKNLCAQYGHQGASATFFCLFCQKRRGCAPGRKAIDNPVPDLRSLEGIREDFSKYCELIAAHGSHTKAAQNCHSIYGDPIAHLEISDVIPSPFHVVLGLFHSLFEKLELALDILDSGDQLSTTKRGKRVGKRTAEGKVKLAHSVVASSEKEMADLSVIENIHRSFEDNSIQPSHSEELCDSALCLVRDVRAKPLKLTDKALLKCVCGKRVHPHCNLLVSEVSINKEKRGGFVCRDCAKPRKSCLKEITDDLMPYFISTLDIAKEAALNEDGMAEMNRKGGDNRSILNRMMKEHNVVRDLVTKQFTGNNMKRVLSVKMLRKIEEAFSEAGEIVGNVISALSVLSKVVELTKAEILDASEIDILETSISELQSVWFRIFPEKNHVLPKAHWLFNHVIPCVKRDRTWGLISDQSIEAIHHLWNEISKKFSNKPMYQDVLHRSFIEILILQEAHTRG